VVRTTLGCAPSTLIRSGELQRGKAPRTWEVACAWQRQHSCTLNSSPFRDQRAPTSLLIQIRQLPSELVLECIQMMLATVVWVSTPIQDLYIGLGGATAQKRGDTDRTTEHGHPSQNGMPWLILAPQTAVITWIDLPHSRTRWGATVAPDTPKRETTAWRICQTELEQGLWSQPDRNLGWLHWPGC